MKSNPNRQALIDAAVNRFHRHGVSASSIADVANDAGIPPGNVYYYFRTKDALATAVHRHWEERIRGALDDISASRHDPADRLITFLERSEQNAAAYAGAGCPLAALSRAFRGGSASLQALSGAIFGAQLDWLEQQFAALGLEAATAAREALAIMTAVQGGIALAHATDSPAPVLTAVNDAKQRVHAISAARRKK